MKSFWFAPCKLFFAILPVACYSFAASYVPPATAVSKINSYRGYSELTSAASGMDIDQYAYNIANRNAKMKVKDSKFQKEQLQKRLGEISTRREEIAKQLGGK